MILNSKSVEITLKVVIFIRKIQHFQDECIPKAFNLNLKQNRNELVLAEGVEGVAGTGGCAHLARIRPSAAGRHQQGVRPAQREHQYFFLADISFRSSGKVLICIIHYTIYWIEVFATYFT